MYVVLMSPDILLLFSILISVTTVQSRRRTRGEKAATGEGRLFLPKASQSVWCSGQLQLTSRFVPPLNSVPRIREDDVHITSISSTKSKHN